MMSSEPASVEIAIAPMLIQYGGDRSSGENGKKVPPPTSSIHKSMPPHNHIESARKFIASLVGWPMWAASNTPRSAIDYVATDGEQPGPADPLVERRLALLDGEARKYSASQQDPEQGRDEPEHRACAIVSREQHELAPDDAGAGHGREESRPRRWSTMSPNKRRGYRTMRSTVSSHSTA